MLNFRFSDFPFNIDLVQGEMLSVGRWSAKNQLGQFEDMVLVNETPLSLYLNKQEIVTLMTMGSEVVYLVLGFLLNQHLLTSVADVSNLQIDWQTRAAVVRTKSPTPLVEKRLQKRVITSGCGQGTMFEKAMHNLIPLPKNPRPLKKSQIYGLLAQLAAFNPIYQQAGGVHSCAICTSTQVLKSIEDVGRHNALDALRGYLACHPQDDAALLYTTGRLTSEMLIKCAQMNIHTLVSRSSATAMGMELAQQLGITVLARAKGQRFLLLNGEIEFDC